MTLVHCVVHYKNTEMVYLKYGYYFSYYLTVMD